MRWQGAWARRKMLGFADASIAEQPAAACSASPPRRVASQPQRVQARTKQPTKNTPSRTPNQPGHERPVRIKSSTAQRGVARSARGPPRPNEHRIQTATPLQPQPAQRNQRPTTLINSISTYRPSNVGARSTESAPLRSQAQTISAEPTATRHSVAQPAVESSWPKSGASQHDKSGPSPLRPAEAHPIQRARPNRPS